MAWMRPLLLYGADAGVLVGRAAMNGAWLAPHRQCGGSPATGDQSRNGSNSR